jgi:hypothetical protein
VEDLRPWVLDQRVHLVAVAAGMIVVGLVRTAVALEHTVVAQVVRLDNWRGSSPGAAQRVHPWGHRKAHWDYMPLGQLLFSSNQGRQSQMRAEQATTDGLVLRLTTVSDGVSRCLREGRTQR